jgi:hypothetical protein
MQKLTLIAVAAIAAIILAPRTTSAEHIEPPSKAFVR